MEKEKTQLILDRNQMKRIARYELTFADLSPIPDIDALEIICPEVYSFILADMEIALRNMKAANPDINEFGDFWLYPLMCLEKEFDLDRARGYLEDVDDTPEELKGYRGLPTSDSALFESIWNNLEYAWQDNEDISLSESIDIDAELADLSRYLSNKGKPIEDWSFTRNEMKNYVRSFEQDHRVANASEKELLLCRKMIEALISMDSKLALRIKGYACYGGNRLYECSWPASRDCMLRLFEKTDDPQYANTLGYIFYYGRCTGGVPEYEKAFHYFGIAAANGLYEGLYKLADMFHHGYGCQKSDRTACALYSMVYDDSIKSFLKGENANFADAALRMGNVYAEGINRTASPVAAYRFYLEAFYAAKIRAKQSDFFGNTTVIMNIEKAIARTKQELSTDFFRDSCSYNAPFVFHQLAKDNYRCSLTRKILDNGNVALTAKRLPGKSNPKPDSILVTIPELDFCERGTKFTMTALGDINIWFKDVADTIRYDYCSENEKDRRYEFYYDDELVGWINCEGYEIKRPKRVPKSGNEYRFATVRFSAGGRTYDYLCNIEDVHPGDRVIVNGYDGETVVYVMDVYVRSASELPLPLERYKEIIRKC